MASSALRVLGIGCIVTMLALSFGDAAHAAVVLTSVNQGISLSNDDGGGPYTYSQSNSSSLGTTSLNYTVYTVDGTATHTEAWSTQTISLGGATPSIELYTSGYGLASAGVYGGPYVEATGQGSDSLTFQLTNSAIVTVNYTLYGYTYDDGFQGNPATNANAGVSFYQVGDGPANGIYIVNPSTGHLGTNGGPLSLTDSIQVDLNPGDYVLSSTAFGLGGVGGAGYSYGQASADISLTLSPTAVPEPSSLITFLGLGGCGLFGFVWRRRRRLTAGARRSSSVSPVSVLNQKGFTMNRLHSLAILCSVVTSLAVAPSPTWADNLTYMLLNYPSYQNGWTIDGGIETNSGSDWLGSINIVGGDATQRRRKLQVSRCT
jgi:hypothetical protein